MKKGKIYNKQTRIDTYTEIMLKDVCEKENITESDLVRKAIVMYLNNFYMLNGMKLPKMKGIE